MNIFDWTDSTKLSRNFSLRELTKSSTAVRKNIDNSVKDRDVYNYLVKVCKHILQPIREHYDIPFSPNSGYRCPELNTAIGGSTTSQHCSGQAVDIELPTVDNEKLFGFIKDNLEFDQVILEYYNGIDSHSGGVHVSYISPKMNRNRAMTFDGKNYRIIE